MKIVALAAALGIAPIAATAQDSEKIAERLATVLVGAEMCGIALDTGAVIAHMTASIDAGDLDFTGDLDREVTVAQYQTRNMAGAQADLHCAQIRRNAGHYGWLKSG